MSNQLKSMTGYGVTYGAVGSGDSSMEVVVQSVNGKFLEVTTHIPDRYISMEQVIIAYLKKHFVRGNVSINIHRVKEEGKLSQKSRLKWSRSEARKWQVLYKEMADVLAMDNNLDLHSLVHLPGVLVRDEGGKVLEREKLALLALVKQAILLCMQERCREGVALQKAMHVHLKQLLTSLKVIKRLFMRSQKSVRDSLKKKLHLLNSHGGDESKVNEGRVSTDITNIINKIDISEELARMQEHVKVCELLLCTKKVRLKKSKGKPVGKKAGFYFQEMVREMNTIGSKSQSFRLTKEVIVAKSIIESMREQIQNVE